MFRSNRPPRIDPAGDAETSHQKKKSPRPSSDLRPARCLQIHSSRGEVPDHREKTAPNLLASVMGGIPCDRRGGRRRSWGLSRSAPAPSEDYKLKSTTERPRTEPYASLAVGTRISSSVALATPNGSRVDSADYRNTTGLNVDTTAFPRNSSQSLATYCKRGLRGQNRL
jgi:hypothetical protein